MKTVKSFFVIQLTGEDGSWFDFDAAPLKFQAEANFANYKKNIPKTRKLRLIRRTEEVLGIRN